MAQAFNDPKLPNGEYSTFTIEMTYFDSFLGSDFMYKETRMYAYGTVTSANGSNMIPLLVDYSCECYNLR